MKKKLIKVKKEKGITLIALVVTIVVLLILAGVTIAMLTGDNGILTQAGKAKEETEKAEFSEKINLAIARQTIEQDVEKLENELLGYGYECKKIWNDYTNNYDLEVKNGNKEICLITSKNKVINKIEGKKEECVIGEGRNFRTIVKYIGEDKNELVVPNYIDGIWINQLQGIHAESSIIENYNNIKKIIISKGIEIIGTSSFYKNKSIQEIELSEGIDKLDWGVFYNCTHLKEINFPNSLISIGQCTFDGCINLKEEIVLGDKLTKIDTYAFSNSGVKKVKINRKKGTVTINPGQSFLEDDIEYLK